MNNTWLAHNLRLTLFLSEALNEASSKTFALVSGNEPDSDEARAREGFRRQIGSFSDKSILEAIVTPFRIDINVHPAVGAPDQPSWDFGPFSEELDRLLENSSKLLAEYQTKISRIALAGAMITPVDSHDEGYAKLMSLVPSIRLPEKQEASDLFFQINYPRFSSAYKELKINRLLKWSVMRVQLMAIQGAPMQGGLIPQGGGIIPKSASYAVRAEFDLNTEQNTSLSSLKVDVTKLFEELKSDALAIQVKGERI